MSAWIFCSISSPQNKNTVRRYGTVDIRRLEEQKLVIHFPRRRNAAQLLLSLHCLPEIKKQLA